MKKIVLGSIILIAIAAVFLIFKKDPSKILKEIDTNIFVVSTETAKKRNLKKEVLLSGSIKALEEAVLYPRVEGKLKRNLLKEGDSVKRDQTVALIERDEVGAVYEPVVVPSTISGIVGKIYLDPGQHATKTTPVAFVVNQLKVRVILDVPERYASQLHKGQKATFTVESLPGKEFPAEVTIISPVIDAQSRTVRVELLADNKDGEIKSGMFAKANVILAEKSNALSVSSKNIFEDADKKSYVFLVRDDKASRQDVTIGFSNDEYTEITKGLSGGETVIASAYGLKEGSKVKVQ